MTQAPAPAAARRQVVPVYGAGFVTALGTHAVAANLGRYALGHHGLLWELGLLLGIYDGAEVVLKPVFGAPADRTAEAGREPGDADGPLLVSAVGLISLTAGLGALAAALPPCAALAAPRDHARPSHPPGQHGMSTGPTTTAPRPEGRPVP